MAVLLACAQHERLEDWNNPLSYLMFCCKVTFNFGASPFKYVQHQFWPLHTSLDEKQVQGLSTLFHK